MVRVSGGLEAIEGQKMLATRAMEQAVHVYCC